MLTFTTDDLRPQDRFEYWCEVRCKTLFGVTIELPRDQRGQFNGRFAAREVGDGAVAFEMIGSSYLVKRTKADIARISSESLYVGRQVRGPGYLDVGRDLVQHVFEGGLTVGHTDLPYTATPDYLRGFVFHSVKLPLSEELTLGARLHDLVPALTVPGASYAGLLTAMFDTITRLPDAALRVENDIRDFVRLALVVRGRLAPGMPESRAALRVGALYAAHSILRRDLHAVNLTPERVARELTISLRQLHVVFELSGLSFARTLTMLRIQAACTLLRSGPARSVTDIAFACGFDSLATFYRVFRKATGMTPSDMRALAAEDGGNSATVVAKS